MPDLVPVEHDPFGDAPYPLPVDHVPEFGDAPVRRAAGSIGAPERAPGESVGGIALDLLSMVPGAVRGALGIPQRVANESERLRYGVGYDPAPAVEASMLTMGATPLGVARGTGEAALGAGPIRAYHGSPYDFERFDMSKIGTGEGAQAYGHGLYFAENPETAAAYRKNLTNPNYDFGVGRSKYNVLGDPLPSGMSGHMAIDTFGDMDRIAGSLKYQNDTGYLDSGVMQVMRDRLDRRIAKFREEDAKGWHPGSAGEDMRALADFWEKKMKYALPKDITEARPGKTYEVSINADPEHFLDWDKPLSEQHPKVQQELATLSPAKRPDPFDEMFESHPSEAEGTVPHLMRRLSANDIEASNALRSAGIPGIKYLDQGSRSAGTPAQIAAQKSIADKAEAAARAQPDIEPLRHIADAQKAVLDRLSRSQTRNYVLFRDDIIDILRKYGLAGLSALPPAVAASVHKQMFQPVEHDPFQ